MNVQEWWWAITAVRHGRPVPVHLRQHVSDILHLVMQGKDPRQFAGVKPRRKGDHKAIIGMYYWGLRAQYGSKREESAAQDAAAACGKSKSQVRRIGKDTRSAFKASSFQLDTDTVEDIENEVRRLHGKRVRKK